MLLPFLSAVLGIIAFLPVNFYPAGFVFLVPLFIFFLREEKLRRLVLGALIFKPVFYLGTIYFTLEPLAWGSGLLIFTGLPIAVFMIKKYANNRILLFLLPFLWTVFDILHARYSLLPAYNITAGNALGSSPFVGLAGLGGFALLTFFAASINVLAASIIFYRTQNKNRKIALILTAAILILFFAAYFVSQYRLQKNSSAYNNLPNSIKIAAISTGEEFNLGQFEKLKAELSGGQSDLIIFPEDIFSAESVSPDNQPAFFQNLAQELNANVITVFDTLSNGKKYNSAVLFGKNGQIAGIHNKNRLTFIGEYWPFGDWRPSLYDWLKKRNSKIKDYAVFDPQNSYERGDRKNITADFQSGAISLAMPICLEINYPNDLKEYKESGARFIINPTSNRWIGIGERHFLHLTNNLRTIEAVWLKLPIVSSGVKDFAGIILPDSQTRLVGYRAGDKNYGIFFGKINY